MTENRETPREGFAGVLFNAHSLTNEKTAKRQLPKLTNAKNENHTKSHEKFDPHNRRVFCYTIGTYPTG